MLRNKHGYLHLPAIIALSIIAAITVRGTVDSASTGNLQKGLKTIGHKIMGDVHYDCGFVANDTINPLVKK